jgi:endonuclease YncB( thermonuclease family)
MSALIVVAMVSALTLPLTHPIGSVECPSDIYTYPVDKLIKVYDGDTITVNMDLGLGVSISKHIRLLGIDAPELRGTTKVSGRRSRNYLRLQLKDKHILIHTKDDKLGKYGRLLGTVYVRNKDSYCTNINKLLLSNGMAKRYLD